MKHISKIIQVVVVMLVVLLSLIVYSIILNDNLNRQVETMLEEVSTQNVVVVEKELHSHMTAIVEISERIADAGTLDKEQGMKVLNETIERYQFKRMGIADPDGDVVATDGAKFNLGEREHFQRAINGETVVSTRLSDYEGGGHIIVFATPIKIEEKNEAVLFAVYDINTLEDIILTSSFEDKCYSYIIDGTGKVIAETYSNINKDSKVDRYCNVFDMMIEYSSANKEAADALRNGINNKERTLINITSDEEKYLQSTPISNSDGWYLLNVIPASVMNSSKNVIMNHTYMLTAVIVITFVIFVAYLVQLERKKNKELRNILYVDNVTQKDSYHLFKIKAQELLQSNNNYACITMDINNFKLINEVYGYYEGNRILCYISSIWERIVGEGEVFARTNADHFIALLKYETNDKMIERIDQFIQLIQKESGGVKSNYIFQPRFGIYVIEDNTKDFRLIENNSIIAFSQVKKKRNLPYLIYDSVIKSKMLNYKIKEDQIQIAINNREFEPYYQPKYDTITKEVIGAEALARWIKENEIIIDPDNFIPLSEKLGLIIQIDEQIFESVCAQQRKWLDQGLKIIPISINISKKHLYDISFIDKYYQIRTKYDLPPESIELEITESDIFENQEEFAMIIQKLQSLGFKILMDDFGSGTSSLLMLKNISVDVIKLERQFVSDYANARGSEIISSVVQLAKKLNIKVTAEGVETIEQYQFLKEIHCDDIQGYLFSPPVVTETFEKLLKK